MGTNAIALLMDVNIMSTGIWIYVVRYVALMRPKKVETGLPLQNLS